MAENFVSDVAEDFYYALTQAREEFRSMRVALGEADADKLSDLLNDVDNLFEDIDKVMGQANNIIADGSGEY